MKTKAVFRKFKNGGDIVCIFPDGTWLTRPDHGPYKGSYGKSNRRFSFDLFARITVPAKPKEYKGFRLDLEKIGYSIRVASRLPKRYGGETD